MTIRAVIDKCIDNGAKRFSLSPNPFRTLARVTGIKSDEFGLRYRDARVSVWPASHNMWQQKRSLK